MVHLLSVIISSQTILVTMSFAGTVDYQVYGNRVVFLHQVTQVCQYSIPSALPSPSSERNILTKFVGYIQRRKPLHTQVQHNNGLSSERNTIFSTFQDTSPDASRRFPSPAHCTSWYSRIFSIHNLYNWAMMTVSELKII